MCVSLPKFLFRKQKRWIYEAFASMPRTECRFRAATSDSEGIGVYLVDSTKTSTWNLSRKLRVTGTRHTRAHIHTYTRIRLSVGFKSYAGESHFSSERFSCLRRTVGRLPVIARRATAACSHRWQVFISTARTEAASSAVNHSRLTQRHTGGSPLARQSGRVNRTMRNYSAPHLPPLARAALFPPPLAGSNPLARPCGVVAIQSEVAVTLRFARETGRLPRGITGTHAEPHVELVRPLVRDGRERRIQITGRPGFVSSRAPRAFENFFPPGCRSFFLFFFLLLPLFL